jgi:hypothetical protein
METVQSLTETVSNNTDSESSNSNDSESKGACAIIICPWVQKVSDSNHIWLVGSLTKIKMHFLVYLDKVQSD